MVRSDNQVPNERMGCEGSKEEAPPSPSAAAVTLTVEEERELRRLHAQLDHHEQYRRPSFALPAGEPFDVTRRLREKLIVARAARYHDINDDPDQFTAATELPSAEASAYARKKVHAWLQEVHAATEGMVSPRRSVATTESGDTVAFRLTADGLSDSLDRDAPMKPSASVAAFEFIPLVIDGEPCEDA